MVTQVKDHQHFYNDPDTYDLVLWEDSLNETDYYFEYAKEGKSILYLGSGTGRILKKLYEVNQNIVGVDISENMCKKCREIIPGSEIVNADVLSMNLGKRFDYIIAPYDFPNHFDKEKLEILLKNIKSHLNENGSFISQLKNPYHCVNKPNKSELIYVEMVAGNIFEKGYVTYDREKRMYFDYIERMALDTNEHTLITMDWYYYFLDELEPLFSKQGITITNILGDFDRSSFNEKSPVMIIEGKC